MESAAFIPAGTVLGQCPLYAHVSTNPQQLIYLKRLCNERKTTAYTGTWGTLITWQLGAVDATYQKTALTKSLTLSVPRWSGHLAGQHVDIRLTAEDGYQAERGYSIASPPEDGQQIVLTIERLDDGEVSPYLADELRVGDKLELRGPIGGYFVWEERLGGPLL